jgi:fructokinase
MRAVSELYGGVETGGTWCVCAVGRGPGELLARDQFRTGEPEETIERIAAFFAGAPDVAAIGIGSFGPVDLVPDSPSWGHVTTTPKPGWQHVGIGPALRERLGVPVAFDLDVTAAAVGEHRWGAGQGAGSLCYLTVGTGIGAGLLIDGVPRHGLVHPEVGHMRVDHDRARDPFDGCCPVHGDCWEGLASGPAIAARWDRDPEDLPGDHPAWALEADYLAAGILNIVLVFSPERVIVGGGVLEHPPMLGLVRHRVVELLGGYLDTPFLHDEEIDSYLVPPALGDDAGVLGAIALAQALRPEA